MNEVAHLLRAQNKLGEGPLWHVGKQALYWVDILDGRFHRLGANGEMDTFTVGLPVGVLAFRAQGGLVMATKGGFAFWDPESQSLQFIIDPEADKPEARFNDGAVDPQGRFWAGTMSDQPINSLYRFDPNGSVQRMESGITVSNGIGWSLDQQTMYFTDTPRRLIYAYDFDGMTGEIANRRPFIHVADDAGFPDGLTVDGEGCIWCAHWDGWRITRYDPDGKVERVIPMPVQRPTSCTFGGPNLDELYITSAWVGLSEAARQEQPLAGDLFRLPTDVKGLPEPEFAG